ncbi:MAG: sigma-70 family RNA polymerase sigma factor [Planctomycetota bacterium]
MPDPLADLYDAHATWLWRTARSWLRNDTDAEDAVHEVFLGVARAGVAAALDNPRAYLASGLVHACTRLKQRRMRAPIALADHDPPQPVEDRQSDERLDRVLSTLPNEQREVVVLKIEGDLTFAAIGEALGISPNTAASRWRIAIAHLRELLPEDA